MSFEPTELNEEGAVGGDGIGDVHVREVGGVHRGGAGHREVDAVAEISAFVQVRIQKRQIKRPREEIDHEEAIGAAAGGVVKKVNLLAVRRLGAVGARILSHKVPGVGQRVSELENGVKISRKCGTANCWIDQKQNRIGN